MKAGIVNLRAGKLAGEDEREPLNAAWAAVQRAEEDRAHAVIDALLGGMSQREVAKRAGLAVNTVRAIMQGAGIEFKGLRYEVNHFGAQGDEPRDTGS